MCRICVAKRADNYQRFTSEELRISSFGGRGRAQSTRLASLASLPPKLLIMFRAAGHRLKRTFRLLLPVHQPCNIFDHYLLLFFMDRTQIMTPAPIWLSTALTTMCIIHAYPQLQFILLNSVEKRQKL